MKKFLMFLSVLGAMFASNAFACVPNQPCGDMDQAQSHFDFNVTSGGYSQNLYVCEVGFKAHTCTGICNAADDYLNVNNASGLVTTIHAPNSQTFTAAQAVTSADVFLNSTNFGAGWYVRYCYDLTRGVAGTDPVSDIYAQINAEMMLITNADNGYINASTLEWQMEYACTDDAGVSVGPSTDSGLVGWDDFDNSINGGEQSLVTSNVCLSGTPGCHTKSCHYDVEFQEKQTCIRTLKDPTCTTLDCFWTANFGTSLTVNTHLCTNASCPVVQPL